MPEQNPTVGWHVGEPKTPTYDGFRFTNSRRLSQDAIDAAEEAAHRWASLRLWRFVREYGFSYAFEVAANKETQRDAEHAEWPLGTARHPWTIGSDLTAAGEEAVRLLGLNGFWRAILGLPPLCGICGRPDDEGHEEGICATPGEFDGLDALLDHWKDQP